MRNSTFTIETYQNNTFEGYTQDEHWNGWSCPYFTFEQSHKIVESHRKTGQMAGFDKDSNAFYFDFQDERELYQFIEIESIKFYPIGNSAWIWEEIN